MNHKKPPLHAANSGLPSLPLGTAGSAEHRPSPPPLESHPVSGRSGVSLAIPKRAWLVIRLTWSDPAVRLGLTAFIVLRIVTAVWLWGIRQVFDQPLPPDPFYRQYVGVEVETRPWLEPWQRWDTLQYQAIAERGYLSFESSLFVPPLFPLAIRLTGELIGGDTLLAGILISNLACAAAFVAFARLAFLELESRAAARRSLLYLAFSPAAFFLVAAYTESLYLLAAVLVVLYLRRQHFLRAGFWGAVACLSRSPGVVVLVPMIFSALTAGPRNLRAWGGVLMATLGALAFPLYVWLLLKVPPWTPVIVMAARQRGGFSIPGANVLEALRQIVANEFFAADILDLLAIVLFGLLAIPVWRRLPRVHGIYYATLLGLLLSRMGTDAPLLGTARYVLSLFPAFLVLGEFGENPWVHRAILYTSWLGILYMSAQFAVWGWVG